MSTLARQAATYASDGGPTHSRLTFTYATASSSGQDVGSVARGGGSAELRASGEAPSVPASASLGRQERTTTSCRLYVPSGAYGSSERPSSDGSPRSKRSSRRISSLLSHATFPSTCIPAHGTIEATPPPCQRGDAPAKTRTASSSRAGVPIKFGFLHRSRSCAMPLLPKEKTACGPVPVAVRLVLGHAPERLADAATAASRFPRATWWYRRQSPNGCTSGYRACRSHWGTSSRMASSFARSCRMYIHAVEQVLPPMYWISSR